MACAYYLKSVVLVGSIPDAAPNTTPPVASRLMELRPDPPNGQGNSAANGVSFFFKSDNGSTGTVTWTAWVFDEQSKAFVKTGSGTTTGDHVETQLTVVLGAKLFVQITATAGFAGAAQVETHAVEMIR